MIIPSDAVISLVGQILKSVVKKVTEKFKGRWDITIVIPNTRGYPSALRKLPFTQLEEIKFK